MNAPVWRCKKLVMDGFRSGSRRLKKHWGKMIRQDMINLQLIEEMTLDRKVWKTQIRVEG